MAKQTGLATSFWVDGVDLSGDINSLQSVACPMAIIPQTAITQSGMARAGGLQDGAMSVTAYFNPSTAQAHPTLSAHGRSDRILTYATGSLVGSPAACLNAKQVTYDPTRADDSQLTIAVEAQGNGFGLEWATLATAGKRTDTAATNGAGIDQSASSAFGLQAYLHVFTGFAGTSVTVKLQHSNDNGGVDPYTDLTGGGFTAATGITFQRIATTSSLTVKRWLRVVTTGTFSNAVFAVAVNRNLTSVVF